MKITASDIIRYREENNLTQGKLAKQIGVALRTIQNYESGGKIPASKQALFVALFESKGYNDAIGTMQIGQETTQLLQQIPVQVLAAYVIINKEEFLKEPVFRMFVEKMAHDKAIKIIKDI